MTGNKASFQNLPSLQSKNKEIAAGQQSPLTMDQGILQKLFSPFTRMTNLNPSGTLEKAWKRFTK